MYSLSSYPKYTFKGTFEFALNFSCCSACNSISSMLVVNNSLVNVFITSLRLSFPCKTSFTFYIVCKTCALVTMFHGMVHIIIIWFLYYCICIILRFPTYFSLRYCRHCIY